MKKYMKKVINIFLLLKIYKIYIHKKIITIIKYKFKIFLKILANYIIISIHFLINILNYFFNDVY